MWGLLLAFAVLRTEPWAFCMLYRHSTNRATAPDSARLKVQLWLRSRSWDHVTSVKGPGFDTHPPLREDAQADLGNKQDQERKRLETDL